MTQDLIEWLSATHKEEIQQGDKEEMSLLVVPVLPAPAESPELPPVPARDTLPHTDTTPKEAPSNDEFVSKITALNDAWQTVEEHEASPNDYYVDAYTDDSQTGLHSDTYPNDSRTASQAEKSPDAWRQALDDSQTDFHSDTYPNGSRIASQA